MRIATEKLQIAHYRNHFHLLHRLSTDTAGHATVWRSSCGNHGPTAISAGAYPTDPRFVCHNDLCCSFGGGSDQDRKLGGRTTHVYYMLVIIARKMARRTGHHPPLTEIDRHEVARGSANCDRPEAAATIHVAGFCAAAAGDLSLRMPQASKRVCAAPRRLVHRVKGTPRRPVVVRKGDQRGEIRRSNYR